MNETMKLTNAAQNLVDQLRLFAGVFFVGITYASKSTGEVARFTVRVGQSYVNALKADIALLEGLQGTLEGIDETARQNLLASLNKSLAAAEAGTESEDYTKKGSYTKVCNGIRMFEDGTLELRGFVHAKRVLVEGTYKKVNSKPLTIAQNKLRKLLKISKYRSFCLDAGNLESVRVSGQEFTD